jgi:hypothetical protein
MNADDESTEEDTNSNYAVFKVPLSGKSPKNV